MIRAKRLLAMAGTMALCGCGTYSFGPPEVSMNRRTAEQDVSETCLSPAGGDKIAANVDGALDLIDNFVGAYRCTLRIAADGRQSWQLPGFVALVGAATASALGGGRDWAIAGGAASSMFNAGNSYYDHVGQAKILQDAVDALTCVEMEAVGAEAYAKAPAIANAPAKAREEIAEKELQAAREAAGNAAEALSAAERRETNLLNQVSANRAAMNALTSQLSQSSEATNRLNEAREQESRLSEAFSEAQVEVQVARSGLSRATSDLTASRNEYAAARAATAELGEVSISAERQYFNMVSAALVGIEAVAAGRLRERGTYNPAGVIAQIKDLTEKADAAQKKADEAGGAPSKGMVASFANRAIGISVNQIQLQLEVLRPKLEKCILRAQAPVGPTA